MGFGAGLDGTENFTHIGNRSQDIPNRTKILLALEKNLISVSLRFTVFSL